MALTPPGREDTDAHSALLLLHHRPSFAHHRVSANIKSLCCCVLSPPLIYTEQPTSFNNCNLSLSQVRVRLHKHVFAILVLSELYYGLDYPPAAEPRPQPTEATDYLFRHLQAVTVRAGRNNPALSRCSPNAPRRRCSL